MPASTKSREKSNTYKNQSAYYVRAANDKRLYANESSAYEMPLTYPEKRVRPSGPVTVEKRRRGVSSKANTNKNVARVFAFVAALAALCFVVIYRQTVILESNQEIKRLEKEYAALLSSNQAMQSKIDIWLEMGEVEKYAKEELGMIKPETNQIFYIDMDMEDMSGEGSVSSSAASAVSGIQGTLVNAFRVLK